MSEIKICPNCGRKNLTNNLFCEACGYRFAPNQPSYGEFYNPTEQKKSGKIWIILIPVVILLIAIVAVGIFFLTRSGNDSKIRRSRSSIDSEYVEGGEILEGEAAPIENYEGASQGSSGAYDDTTAFGLDPSTVENFSYNLEPGEYLRYSSGVSDFSFYYPAYLYYRVTVDKSEISMPYGTRKEFYEFGTTEGSTLTFTRYDRTDGLSLDGMREKIMSDERVIYYDINEMINKTSDEHGKIVFIGRIREGGVEREVYTLIKIERDYVMSMVSKTTVPRNEDERLMQAYVIECLYRMCGFSDSTAAPRSYNEFLVGNR